MKILTLALNSTSAIINTIPPVSAVNLLSKAEIPNISLKQQPGESTIKNISSIFLRSLAFAGAATSLIKLITLYNITIGSVKLAEAIATNATQKKEEAYHPALLHLTQILYDSSFLLLLIPLSYLPCPLLLAPLALGLLAPVLMKGHSFIFPHVPSENNKNQPLLLWSCFHLTAKVLAKTVDFII
jgi:hypothetical protein